MGTVLFDTGLLLILTPGVLMLSKSYIFQQNQNIHQIKNRNTSQKITYMYLKQVNVTKTKLFMNEQILNQI